MSDQGGFHLHGADAVTGDIQHVVHPTEDPEVAVLVALGAVAREVQVLVAGPGRKVCVHVTLRITPDGAQHGWPRPGNGEETTPRPYRIALAIEELGRDTGEGNSGA